MTALRKAAAVLGAISLATACTSLIGLEDLPPAPVLPDSGPAIVTPEAGADGLAPANELAAAVAESASAFCRRYQQCSRAVFDYSYRDIEECSAAFTAIRTYAATLPGAAGTPKTYRDCAINYAALPCDQFTSRDADFACNVRGTRKVNERCIADSQCETGFCGSDRTTCRGCATPPERGAACSVGGFCGAGLVCNSKNVCVAQATADQSCSPGEQPCRSGLECINDVCRAVPGVAGAPCTEATGGCDITRGLFCIRDRCVSIVPVGPGASCEFDEMSPKLCRRGAACGDAGTCAAPPAEGEPCETSGNTPSCLLPLRCVDNTCVQPRSSSFCE